MSGLTREINKAAHDLALLYEIRQKRELSATCRQMLKDGKPLQDVVRHLERLVAEGAAKPL